MLVETNDITQLKALIADQQRLIEQLRAKIADLETRLAQNSTNSHKPPSSDGLAKKPLSRAAAIKLALPKDSTKKQGGQPLSTPLPAGGSRASS
jgi:hypothetical protein